MNVSSGQGLRVAFSTNIISPYRRPVLQNLAATPGWQLRVFVNQRTEFDRDWTGTCEGVDVVQPRTWSARRRRRSKGPVPVRQTVEMHVPIGLWRALSRFDPDVVITHELGPRSYLAARWARMHRRPLVVWSYQSLASAKVGGLVRRHVRNSILAKATCTIGMGKQARTVLEGFGVDPSDIIDASNATDVAMLQQALLQARASGETEQLRRRLGRGKNICLVAGRLEPVKHIEGTLEMWRSLPQGLRDRWQLVFVGNGSLQPLVEHCADPSVSHEPGVSMQNMAGYYAASDLHLFASLADVWGLVVNESMLAGLPTLCSRLAGCADDMIEHGHNGLLFDPSYHEGACRALRAALERKDLMALGQNAELAGAEYSIERLSDAFRSGVQRATATEPSHTLPLTPRPQRCST